MVLIKPFPGWVPGQREKKERSPEALHHSTQLCTLYIFKRPGTLDSQQESGHEDPRHHPLLIRQGEKEARKNGAGTSLPIPRDFPLGGLPVSIQHCLKTTAAASRSPEHTCSSIPALGGSSQRPGHRGKGGRSRAGVGAALTKDPLVPKARWQEARAKSLHSLPTVPGCQAVWVEGDLFSEHLSLMLYLCFYTRPPVKSLPQQPQLAQSLPSCMNAGP